MHVNGKLAAQDPNYSQAAGNRSVTAAQIDRLYYMMQPHDIMWTRIWCARSLRWSPTSIPSAVSRKGAMGLMQLMPATAREYDVRNPFDAAQNVDAGVRHLKGLLKNFGGDVSLSSSRLQCRTGRG